MDWGGFSFLIVPRIIVLIDRYATFCWIIVNFSLSIPPSLLPWLPTNDEGKKICNAFISHTLKRENVEWFFMVKSTTTNYMRK